MIAKNICSILGENLPFQEYQALIIISTTQTPPENLTTIQQHHLILRGHPPKLKIRNKIFTIASILNV